MEFFASLNEGANQYSETDSSGYKLSSQPGIIFHRILHEKVWMARSMPASSWKTIIKINIYIEGSII